MTISVALAGGKSFILSFKSFYWAAFFEYINNFLI
jgi:hypothetical protein